jgi:hypothetical protein
MTDPARPIQLDEAMDGAEGAVVVPPAPAPAYEDPRLLPLPRWLATATATASATVGTPATSGTSAAADFKDVFAALDNLMQSSSAAAVQSESSVQSRGPFVVIVPHSGARFSAVTIDNAVRFFCEGVWTEPVGTVAATTSMAAGRLALPTANGGKVSVPVCFVADPSKLAPKDWAKVIAVVLSGDDWQFADSNVPIADPAHPTASSAHSPSPSAVCAAFCCLYYFSEEAGAAAHPASHWKATGVPVPRTRRHKDKAAQHRLLSAAVEHAQRMPYELSQLRSYLTANNYI